MDPILRKHGHMFRKTEFHGTHTFPHNVTRHRIPARPIPPRYGPTYAHILERNVRNETIQPPRCNDKSLDSLGESYNYSPSPMKCKKKKSRTVFSRNQVYQLESTFDLKRYLSSAERTALAARLNLSETQIKIWFQNRRNKWKRQINGEMDEIPIPPAFAANFLPYAQPSYNSYGHVLDSREELFRSALSGQTYYSHPYVR